MSEFIPFEIQQENALEKINTLDNLTSKCSLAPTGAEAIEMLVAGQEILSAILAMIPDSKGISLASISLEACDETSSNKFSLDMELYLELLASGTHALTLLRSMKSEEDSVESDLPTEHHTELLEDVTAAVETVEEMEGETDEAGMSSGEEPSQGPFNCLICIPNAVFCDEHELTSHLRSMHVTVSSDGQRLVDCPECEIFSVRLTPTYESDDQSALNTAHQVIHEHLLEAHSTSEIPDIINCDEEEDCEAAEDAQRETKSKRKREKNKGGAVCQVCGKTLLQTNLAVHFRLVHLKEAKLKCQECGKGYSYKRDLNQHMFRAHGLNSENLPVFACSQCPYKALRKFYYDRHLQTSHLDVEKAKSYQCEHCGKSFNVQTSLNSHLKQHRKVENLEKKPCPHCQFRGRNASVVKHHIDTVHNNLKTLGCAADCGYHAGFTSTLSNHQKKCPTFKKFISNAWDESQNGFKCPTPLCKYINFYRAQFLMHYTKCKQNPCGNKIRLS